MALIERFQRSGESFGERTGEPDEFSCAVGRIAIWFSALEDEITHTISHILRLEETTADILTVELSFKNKVHLLASLVRARYDLSTSIGSSTLDEYLSELVARTFEAEQFRNQIMHSSWIGPFLRDGRAERRKITAKASRGHFVASEEVDAAYLLDIADFIACIMMEVETFRDNLPPMKWGLTNR
jgi:hypothetical protein